MWLIDNLFVTMQPLLQIPNSTTALAGLIAYYPFDTDTTDKSANSNNATAYGNPTYIVGESGNAISLNGTNQYVQMPISILSNRS